MQMTYQRLWILANVVGCMLSVLSIFIVRLMGLQLNGLALTGLAMGLTLGGLQASVLSQRLPRLKVWHWIVATGLGTYVGLAIWNMSNLWQANTGQGPFFIVLSLFEPLIDGNPIPFLLTWPLLFVGGGISLGISVGIAQVLVLRQHILSWRRWLTMVLLGQTLGGTIAFYGVLHITNIRVATENLGDVFWDIVRVSIVLAIRGICFAAVGGVIYGSITAIALRNLRPRQQTL